MTSCGINHRERIEIEEEFKGGYSVKNTLLFVSTYFIKMLAPDLFKISFEYLKPQFLE
jgi:hypothetical protein